MHNLMCAYRKMFVTAHYEYVGLFDPSLRKEVSWKEKIFCKNEYADEEVVSFLHNLDEPRERRVLWQHWERMGEIAELKGKKVIIKTTYLNGFFPNLFRMSTGVNIWNNAHYAKADGIPVLKPVALIEKRCLTQSKSSIVYLYEGELCDSSRLEQVRELYNLLVQKNVTHHDFYLRNIVVLEDGSLQLIDIDKIHWYPAYSYVFKLKARQEESRFLRDLQI